MPQGEHNRQNQRDNGDRSRYVVRRKGKEKGSSNNGKAEANRGLNDSANKYDGESYNSGF